MTEFQTVIERLVCGEHLSVADAGRAFQIIMAGGATPAQIAALLVALRINKETSDELTGAAMAVRNKAQKLDVPPNIVDRMIDTCGTGGDSKGTYNISTAVAFVVAACGVPVAKHGNKAVSSRSGSADVLQALGVNIEADYETTLTCLQEANICFMMAPRYHLAMRNVAPVRQELGIRTIFNIIGPLVNPALPRRQLVGVFSRELIEPVANVLKNLGSKRAWVVHGSDGMDEITVSGETYAAELKDGEIRNFVIKPQELGIEEPENPDELIGGGEIKNAQALKNVLKGEHGAYRNIVLLNSAASLIIAEKALNIREGIRLAADAIDSGRAKRTLDKLVEISNKIKN